MYDPTYTTITGLWKNVFNFEDARRAQLNKDAEASRDVGPMNKVSQMTLPSQDIIRDPSRCKRKGDLVLVTKFQQEYMLHKWKHKSS